MFAGEFFLKLTNEALLDAVEATEKFVGYIEDDRAATLPAVNLTCGCDVQVTKGSAKFRRRRFKIVEFLSHLGFELVRFL